MGSTPRMSNDGSIYSSEWRMAVTSSVTGALGRDEGVGGGLGARGAAEAATRARAPSSTLMAGARHPPNDVERRARRVREAESEWKEGERGRCPYTIAHAARRLGHGRCAGLRVPLVSDTEKRNMKNVFSPLLKIAHLTNLDTEFEKTPIVRNVVLFEFYNFVKRLDPKFCMEI